MTPHLHATGLSCERDDRVLFDDLTFHVRPGELLQVTGPNGCGKTSLLRLLAGLMSPSAGTVTFDERPPARCRTGQLLWLGHAPAVKDLLTAEENLAWLCALQAPATAAAIRTALGAVGLRGFEDVPCQMLSAGQRRRVGLARLYLDPPPVWLLDEPFTALDRDAVAQLEAHLVAHCERGGSVVLTTHHSLAIRPAAYRELTLGRFAA